jgi:hypothetical protein
MLFRNNEKFELTAHHKKEVDKFLNGRYPARFIFPKGFYIPNPNPEDYKRVDRPSAAIIPFEEITNDKESDMQVHWRYTKVPPIPDGKGGYNFSATGDTSIQFKGSMSLGKNDMELLYFLIFISKCGTHNEHATRPIFEIVNKAASAKTLIEKEALEADVKSAIVGSMKVEKEEIIRVSRAFGLTLTADMTEEEMRSEVLHAVKNRENTQKDGYVLFLELINNKERTVLINTLSKIKQLNLITFAPTANSWIEIDSTGKRVRDICKVPKGKDADKHLEFQLLNDQDVAETVKEILATHELNLSQAV